MLPEIFHVPTYWLKTLLGLALLIGGAVWQAPRIGIARREVLRIALIGIVAGYFGAQLFSLLLHWSWIRSHWWMSWWEQLGQIGLVLYGWTLGGFLGGSIYVLRRGLPWGKLADLFAPWMLLAQAFNRVGCFLTGCCYGITTTLPWGVRFPHLREPVHPTQLYEVGFDLALFLGLLWFAKRKRFEGQVALLYFLGYAMWRFGIEFLRADAVRLIGWLSVGQVVSLAILAAGSWGWVMLRGRRPVGITPAAQMG